MREWWHFIPSLECESDCVQCIQGVYSPQLITILVFRLTYLGTIGFILLTNGPRPKAVVLAVWIYLKEPFF